jgi:hypothetical protein
LCLNDFQHAHQRLPSALEMGLVAEKAIFICVGVDAFVDDSDGLLEFFLLMEPVRTSDK